MSCYPNENIDYVLDIATITKNNPDILCKHCHKPVVRPIHCHKCEDLACYKCINSNNLSKCCKFTREIYNNPCEMDYNGYGFKLIHKKLQKLEMYCLNKQNGCTWIGTRKDFINDYWGHYYCFDKYFKKCIYGCDKLIDHNNANVSDHFDDCLEFKKWAQNIEKEKNDYDCNTSEIHKYELYKERRLHYKRYTRHKVQLLKNMSDDYIILKRQHDDLMRKYQELSDEFQEHKNQMNEIIKQNKSNKNILHYNE